MDQRFFHIASIRFFHEYSGIGLFDGFMITRSSKMVKLMNNLQLVLKPFFGGFHLLSSDPDLLKGEQEPLLIRIFPKDPLFFNFTDFGQEFRPNSKVFYFSDRSMGSSETLHSGDFASLEDGLAVLNQQMLQDFLPGIFRGEISIRDAGSNALVSGDFTRYFLEKGESVFYLENREVTLGYYRINQGMEKAPFGMVSLEPDKLLEAFQISGNPLSLQIRFRTRKTFWKYILSDRVFDKFSSLSVIDSQNREILFKEGEFEIQPSWKVRSFESEVEIPFNADFNPRFQLVEKSKDDKQAGKVIYKQLPKASPEQLFRPPSNKEVLFSHIFI